MTEMAILSSLIFKEDYARKVIPYLKREYFQQMGEQIVLKLIKDYYAKYSKAPSKETLQIELDNCSLEEIAYDQAKKVYKDLKDAPHDYDWLVDTTEQFCKRQALRNAIMKGAELITKDDTSEFMKMESLVRDAISVSFDTNLGHDWLRDAEMRFDFYHENVSRISLGVDYLDKITNGGIPRKTMMCFIAPPAGGKSLVLCSTAASLIERGYNVAYITLEMSEERINERIDAHLLDIDIARMMDVDKTSFMAKINRFRAKTMGSLKTKQFQDGSNASHFRSWLNELKMMEGFAPDVIIIDYLNIAGSARVSPKEGSYAYVKSTCVELRGLGFEYDAAVITATQLNREGAGSSDPDMTQTAESWGVPQTVDYMLAIISTPQLIEAFKLKFKQLKNRYNDINKFFTGLVGVDKSRMRLRDLDSDDVEEEIPPQKRVNNRSNEDKEAERRFSALMVDE